MVEPTPLLVTLYTSLTSLERLEDREAFLDYLGKYDPAMRISLETLLSLENEASDFFDIEPSRSAEDVGLGIGPAAQEYPTEGIGAKIGRYRLLDRLGEGGCGVVYLAEQQEPVRRRVALKIIRLGMDTENVIARFEMERQSLALMDHPNIARVYDVGATRTGRPFFVMQLVDGQKITDYCDAKELGISQRLKLFTKICQAIQHAHQKGVIHRDIKPSNILVWENDGEAVPNIIDFGIAKATTGNVDEKITFTAFGQFVGTPAYMSPEQATGNGLDVDTRSDIFSLGSLLYELLTGRPPFDQKQLNQAGPDEIRRILREVNPREPSEVVSSLESEELIGVSNQRGCEPHKLAGILRGDLDRILMKALEKDRRRRYATADSFAADVNRYLNCEPISARPSGPMYRFTKLVLRNKIIYAAGALVFLSLVLGLGASLWMFFQANHARDAAERARANEVILRENAQIGMTIAQAAVLLKYGNIQEADDLLAKIPPSKAQPSLESAETFRKLGAWHAREARWHEAANRYAALAYSITSVDGSDAVSFDLLPAAALLCEGGDIPGYNALRAMALARFGNTSNATVAEQLVKACLILPADGKMMKQVEPLIHCLEKAESQGEGDIDQQSWRSFSMALAEYRRNDPRACLQWVDRVFSKTYSPARNVMALTLQAMVDYRLDRHDQAREKLQSNRDLIEQRFQTKQGIFEKGVVWPDWLYARILLREADALMAR